MYSSPEQGAMQKVVFLLQDTGRVYGAERATIELAAGLRELGGLDVRALLIEERRLGLARSDVREAFSARNVPWDTLPTSYAFSPTLVRALRARLQELKPDVVHTVGYKADVHGGLATEFGRRWPVVATVHGWLFRPDWKERFYERVDVVFLRRFTRVVALSRYYEDLLRRLGLRPEQVVRIPTGLPPSAWADRDLARRTFEELAPLTVGVLGRLSWEKNHALLLEAARLLRQQNVELKVLIAGEGPEKIRLRHRIDRSGLTSAVEMLGYVAPDELMRRIQCLVVLSRMENLPYSVLEAMAWCRPVVATGVGGLPDLVVDGETGFLVTPDSAEELAGALRSLARDLRAAWEMGQRGRARLETEFRLETAIERHRLLYSELSA